MATSKGFGRNALYSGMTWFVVAIVSFICVPITVRGLGAAGFGVVALVNAVSGYIGVLDLGLGQGIQRYLAGFVSKGQGATARECVKTVLVWFGGVGVGGAMVMFALAPWLAGTLLKVPPGMESETIAAFRIGAIAFALGIVGQVPVYIVESFLRYDLASIIGITLTVLSVVGPAVLVSLGYGVLAVVWFGVLVNVLVCVVWGSVGLRLLSSLPREGPSFREHRRSFLGFSAAVAANRVWSQVQLETSKIVVGAAAGLAQTAYFQVPNTVTSRTRGLLNRMAGVLLPTGAQLHAAGEHGQLVRLYERSSRVFYLLNACMTAAVVVFAAPILTYWIGPQYGTAGGLAFILLALTSGINAVSMSIGSINLAMGRPKVNLAFSMINSVVNLGTVYFFTVWWGIAGTAASGLLATANVPFFLHYSHRNVIGVSSREVFRKCYMRTTLAVGLVAVVSWFALRPLASNLWITLGLMAVTGAAGLAVSAAFGALTPADWASLRSAFRSPRAKPPTDIHVISIEADGIED